jgi:Ca2+-binding RTX toxin-like protein
MEVWVEDALGYTIAGLKLTPQEAIRLWEGDPFKAIAALFLRDDTVIGSNYRDTLFGYAGDDLLWGRRGRDILNGGKGIDINDGGLGNDKLVDTEGRDWFQFSTEISELNNLGFNYDFIKYLGTGDRIYLSKEIFAGIGDTLGSGEFVDGPQALDGNDRILWHNRIGYFDPDGDGPVDPIPFFTTGNDADVTHLTFKMGAMYGYDGY